jgi:hypothetical protein
MVQIAVGAKKKRLEREDRPSSFISHRDLSAAAACAASTDCPKLHQDTFSLSRRLSVWVSGCWHPQLKFGLTGGQTCKKKREEK